MKKRLLRLLFLSGILLTMLTACEYDFIVPPPPTPPGDTTSFSLKIQPFFNTKCNSCHATRNPILTTGNSYNSIISGSYVIAGNPNTSELYLVCKPAGSGGIDMSMYTSPEELILIYNWIKEGAKNN